VSAGGSKTSARALAKARTAEAAKRRRLRNVLIATLVAALVAVGLFAIYRSTNSATSGSAAPGSTKYAYQVGRPGPGELAPDFRLPSTKGGTVGLTDLRGKTVLTYWHEGLGCQPCWDQIRSIEQDQVALKAAGVDEFVSITSGPLDSLRQEMADDQLNSPTLADTDLTVSRQYQMNRFGMMGDSRDGHSFLLIGKDGKIVWRADYGGAPNYTMYVPVDQLLKDLQAGHNR
jgi:peroxiredoxin Q/BCP